MLCVPEYVDEEQKDPLQQADEGGDPAATRPGSSGGGGVSVGAVTQ